MCFPPDTITVTDKRHSAERAPPSVTLNNKVHYFSFPLWFPPSDSYRSSIFNKKPPDMNCVSFYLQNSRAVSQAAAFVFCFFFFFYFPPYKVCRWYFTGGNSSRWWFVCVWVTEVRLGGCNYRSGVHHVFSVSCQYLLFILFASSQTDFFSLPLIFAVFSSTSISSAAIFKAIKPDIFN